MGLAVVGHHGREGSMNARSIWIRYRQWKQSTAEIARRTGEKECDVDRILARCLDAHYTGRPMPFDKVKA